MRWRGQCGRWGLRRVSLKGRVRRGGVGWRESIFVAAARFVGGSLRGLWGVGPSRGRSCRPVGVCVSSWVWLDGWVLVGVVCVPQGRDVLGVGP
jgi:hypothetical protein